MSKIPDTMAAVVLTGHGGIDRLQWRIDYPCPKPDVGRVLIRVGACGLNNTDINTRTAWYAPDVKGGIDRDSGSRGFRSKEESGGAWGKNPMAFPRIQGADVVGHIVAVGKGVRKSRIGERVICDPWLLANGDYLDAARSQYLGSEVDGGFAQYMVISNENAHAIESGLSDPELATFPCAASTAENLIQHTDLKPGERVVISGASGGVGSMAIQLCKLRGAHVTALAATSKTDQVLELGADRVIDRKSADLADQLGIVDVVLDVVGYGLFDSLIKALRQGGRYSTCGAIAGAHVEFDLRDLIYKDLKMTGATIVPPGTFVRLVRLIEEGLLQPQLAETYSLKDLRFAQEAFLAKKHTGNIVVNCK